MFNLIILVQCFLSWISVEAYIDTPDPNPVFWIRIRNRFCLAGWIRIRNWFCLAGWIRIRFFLRAGSATGLSQGSGSINPKADPSQFQYGYESGSWCLNYQISAFWTGMRIQHFYPWIRSGSAEEEKNPTPDPTLIGNKEKNIFIF